MRRVIPCLLILAALFLAVAPADAASPRPPRFAEPLRAAGGAFQVPPEWDGVWASADSVFDCQNNLLDVETYLDTLCAGQVISFAEDDPTGGLIDLTCTGGADATTVDIDCSGSTEFFPDCALTFAVQLSALRTGDSFVGTSVTSITFDGTGEGCDLLPDECTRVVTRANRIGPAPAAYCTTPTRASSWGDLKLRYR
jgi:hypothetical protein